MKTNEWDTTAKTSFAFGHHVLKPRVIHPTLLPKKYQTEWLPTHQNPFPSYTLCPLAINVWPSSSISHHTATNLYNVLSHFNCWELYFIYTNISASFIPWNIFKSAWLLYSITIHIYHKTIILVCQQEILFDVSVTVHHMTRGTNLMQQLWFIIINISTCFGHLYAHLQEFRLCTAACGVQHWVLWLWS